MVTTRRRNRLPKPDRRRALELLAGCGKEGCREHVLRAHGFTTEQMVTLVRSGLATATPQRVRAGHDTMEIGTLRITDDGQRAQGNEVMSTSKSDWVCRATGVGLAKEPFGLLAG